MIGALGPFLLTAWLLASSPGHAAAARCQALEQPPEALQVAWVSPVRRRVGARRSLEVVPVSQLRAFIREESPDSARLLRALGRVGPRGPRLLRPRRWKITFFDVHAAWLCRPVEGAEPTEALAGVFACPPSLQKGNRFFTGCGYTRDTQTDGRGFDVYRITWQAAASRGFCVMPLDRFLEGA